MLGLASLLESWSQRPHSRPTSAMSCESVSCSTESCHTASLHRSQQPYRPRVNNRRLHTFGPAANADLLIVIVDFSPLHLHQYEATDEIGVARVRAFLTNDAHGASYVQRGPAWELPACSKRGVHRPLQSTRVAQVRRSTRALRYGHRWSFFEPKPGRPPAVLLSV